VDEEGRIDSSSSDMLCFLNCQPEDERCIFGSGENEWIAQCTFVDYQPFDSGYICIDAGGG
jgi:hypothetical protein